VLVTGPIEAPNWTPDGRALIVNGDGRLYRINLDGPARLDEIDTGFAIKLNNDHGISPDGCQLVISDGTENGQSCIYVLPVEGGTRGRSPKIHHHTGTAGRPMARHWPIVRRATISLTFMSAISSAELKRALRMARATAMAPTIRRTGAGSGSIPAAAAPCSCGACTLMVLRSNR
jgi:hypothetical protein